MIGSLSLLAASSPESLWKGWQYGECTKWKRLDSQMGSQCSDGNGDQGSDFEFYLSYVLRGASIVMRRWSDNLHLLGQSKQRWQARNLEFAANSLRSVGSWKDIRTPSQKLQSLQRRTESPKTGGEEKTRNIARPQQAEFITPARHQRSVPVPLPRAMFRGEASNRVGRNDRLGGGCDNKESRES